MKMLLQRLLAAAVLFPLLSAQLLAPGLGKIVSIHGHSRVPNAVAADVPCTITASVRAEDLFPDHISQGELRVKASRAECAHQIVSVVLRLQLNEFSEVVSLKKSVVLPEQWQTMNETGPEGDVVYDYQPYAEATSDPELWNLRGEERQAWTTQVILLEDHPDLTQPIVTPFTVAVPAVNYPPGAHRYRLARNSRHSFSNSAYQYIAIVTFTDGRTVEVPAGHTTFVPVSDKSPTKTPLSWNTTFVDWCRRGDFRDMELERCLPEAGRSEFVAEITLEEGNIVQKGRPVKGRVTVHGTHGSTSMSELSVGIWTAYRDHWAQAQAMAGGDTGFDASVSRDQCARTLSSQPLDAESPSYAHIFADKHTMWSGFPRTTLASSGDNLTAAHPYLDFEFQVPTETPVDFVSYFTNAENQLLITLNVLYSPEVADCLKKPRPAPPKTAADAMAATEEMLWDGHTRVGYPVEFKPPPKPKSQRCVMNLQALMPITVVGSGVAETQPMAHYLTPDLPAPVIRCAPQVEVSEWPIAHSTITEEPLADTLARLLQPHHQSSRYQKAQVFQMNPDPTKGYRGGYYAGLLWKKKVVAEERGILPLLYEAVEPEGGDLQQVLHH